MKIVLSEDNELYRSALKKMLKDFEIVGEAVDGLQTIEIVRLTKPDLLILDLSLPRLSGIAVIKELRKDNTDLKILVLSIHDADSYIQEAIAAGGDGYCSKDESRDKIMMVIQRLLKGNV